MLAVVTLFAVTVVSLLITRVATRAFVLTGMSQEAARFQARSALSGTGFTTAEAEGVITHPVRGRIVMMLMRAGKRSLVARSGGIQFVGESLDGAPPLRDERGA